MGKSFRSLARTLLSLRGVAIAVVAAELLACGGDGINTPATLPTATQLKFTTQPASAAGGAAITPVVQVSVEDASGNVVTSSTASITISIVSGTGTAGAALGGTATASAVSGVATFTGLTIDKVGAGYTLGAAATGLTSATSSAFAVTVGPAAKLAVTAQPSASTGGSAIAPAVQVAIQDLGGNTVTTATTSVTAALVNGTAGATLSGTKTVAAVAGIATFTGLSVDKVGTGYQLTAAATGLTLATSSAFAVTVGPFAKLAFIQQPTTMTAATAAQFQVAVTDAGGNTVPTATNSVGITITPGTGTAGAILGGTLTAGAVAGVVTYATVTVDKVGTGYTLDATSPALTAATSNAFVVNAGAAATIVANGGSVTGTAGAAVATAPKVIVKDAGGNPVSGVSVTFAAATGGGSIAGGTQSTNASGIATPTSWTLGTVAGTNTATATATGLTGSPVTFTAAGVAGAPALITAKAGNNQVANISTALVTSPSVTVTDANNNPVSGVGVTFAVATGGGGVTTATPSSGLDGVATMGTWTLGATAGAQTLTVSATGLGITPLTLNATGIAANAGEFAIANSANDEDFGSMATDGTSYLASVQTHTGASTSNVGAQLISSTGSLVGSQIVVSGYTGDPVKIAFDGTNYLMAWGDHTGATVPILGQFVSASGALVGGVFTIAPGTAAFTGVTTIMFAGGTYFVAYPRDAGGPTAAPAKMYGRVISTAGVVGSELTLSSGFTTQAAGVSSVAFDGANFFTVYTDQSTIKGRFVSSAGVLGSEVTVLTASGYTIENLVSVAGNGTTFLVTFPRKATGSSTANAYGQILLPSGAPSGGLIALASDVNDDQFALGAVRGTGANFVVSYEDSVSTSGHQSVRVLFVGPTGAILGQPITIATTVSGKSPLGGLFLFSGSKYFEFIMRGVSNPADPSNFDTWTQKDLYGALLTIPTPGP